MLGEDILAVGTNNKILALSGPETVMIDLDGKALLPGFVDSHNHIFNDRRRIEEGLTLEGAQELGLKSGTTTMANMFTNAHFLGQMQEFEQQGNLRIRTSLYLLYTDTCGRIQGDWYLEHPTVLDPTQMLRITGVKIFGDQSCEATGESALSFDMPAVWLTMTEEELTEVVVEV